MSWRERGRLWMRLGIRLVLAAVLVLALRYLVTLPEMPAIDNPVQTWKHGIR